MKIKKVRLGPFLIKIVPQKDTVGSRYFEYRPKENLIIFFFCIGGYGVLLGIMIIVLEIINAIKK